MTLLTSYVIPWNVVVIVIVNAGNCKNIVILDGDSHFLNDNLVGDFRAEDAYDLNAINETAITIPLVEETNAFRGQNDNFGARYAIGISDHAKKLVLPFLMGITLKVMTFIPLKVALFFAMGSVALFASKSALTMALLAAYLNYKTKKHKKLFNSLQDMSYYRPLDNWYRMKFMNLMMNHPMSQFHSYYNPYTANWYQSVLHG